VAREAPAEVRLAPPSRKPSPTSRSHGVLPSTAKVKTQRERCSILISRMLLAKSPQWAIAKPPGSRLDLHRELDPDLTRKLRFSSRNSQPKKPFFASKTKLDGQTTRGVRELTPESAELLDRIITITDRAPLSTSMRRITEELLATMELGESSAGN